jgi:hypothetical protein
LLTGQPPEQVAQLLGRLVEFGAVAASPPELEHQAGQHRALYQTELHPLPPEERERLAQLAGEPMLSALCFDPLPAVVRRVMENALAGLAHARLIAAHHRNPVGLDGVVARSELVHDAQVRRRLRQNPQLTEGQLRRLLVGRRLLEVWKLTVSRDLPERSRSGAAGLLRARFAQAPPEERVELIFASEGRALSALSGIPVDGKTTTLLCSRTYHSAMLVQCLARWTAAPPALITHLLKQAVVRTHPQLRAALCRHPNARAQAR